MPDIQLENLSYSKYEIVYFVWIEKSKDSFRISNN